LLVPRIIALLLLFLAVTVPTLAAEAEDRVYQVEIIVFENKIPELVGGEESAAPKLPPLPANAADPTDEAPAGPKLAGVLAALQHDKHYRVLAHHSWVQTAEEKTAVTPVHLHSTGSDELDGVVVFSMSRFLHMNLDLRYRDPSDPASPVYRLVESRRLKSQENHYFDHPRLGAIVRLTPLKGVPKKS
jgi:hypothetical protein